MKKNVGFIIACSVLALLTAIGIGTWIYQISGGLGVTGMNNSVSWGLYTSMFMLFVGLSAGGLIVASAASIFGISKYKKVALPAVILSTVCIVAATGFVLVDLGGVARVFNLFVSPQWNSPLIWDVFVILLYLIINIVYLVLMSRSEKNERSLKVISGIALPIAILVHSITAWIFGLEIAKEGWYSSLLAPLFVVSAIDSGLALLLIVLSVLNKLKVFEVDSKLMASLAGLLATVIAIDAFLIFCELLTLGYPGGSGAELLAIMLTGQTAFFFWGEVFCLVVPFLILVFGMNRERTGLVVASSVLVVVGVLFKRLWLLLTSFFIFNTAGAPGVTVGNSNAAEQTWLLQGTYAPTIVELVITIGIISLAALLYLVLANRLLQQPVEHDVSTAVTPSVAV